jgi:hypothetical protein
MSCPECGFRFDPVNESQASLSGLRRRSKYSSAAERRCRTRRLHSKTAQPSRKHR